jgi:hypothetical protein
MPHGIVFFGNSAILWAQCVISDAVNAAAYYAIPVGLYFFHSKRKKTLRSWWMFLLFCWFYFYYFCGIHINVIDIEDHMESRSNRLVRAYEKLWTGWDLYFVTAILLVPLIPQALALKSPTPKVEAKNKEK